MSENLTTRFNNFESQVASEHTALMAAIASLQDALDLVASNTDLALENGAANTKALLAALGQTGSCFPCPTPSIVVPPTGTTGFPINDEHCKRSQWIITAIQNILSQFDTLQSFNVVGSFNVVNDAISQIIGAIAAGDTIPLPSFPESVQLAGTYVNYAGERAFSGVSLSSQFAPLYGPLVTAVSTTNDAASAQAAYNGIVDGSSASSGAKQLFKALAYNALWTYAFDPASSPDTSAFDGGACGAALPDITACTNFGSAPVEVSPGVTLEVLVIGPSSLLGPTAIAGDYLGYSWEILVSDPTHAVALYAWDTSDGLHLTASKVAGDDPSTIAIHTHAIAVQTLDSNADAHPFVVRICPPA